MMCWLGMAIATGILVVSFPCGGLWGDTLMRSKHRLAGVSVLWHHYACSSSLCNTPASWCVGAWRWCTDTTNGKGMVFDSQHSAVFMSPGDRTRQVLWRGWQAVRHHTWIHAVPVLCVGTARRLVWQHTTVVLGLPVCLLGWRVVWRSVVTWRTWMALHADTGWFATLILDGTHACMEGCWLWHGC